MFETAMSLIALITLSGHLASLPDERREIPLPDVPGVVLAAAVADSPGVAFHSAAVRVDLYPLPWRLTGQDLQGHRVDLDLDAPGRVRRVVTRITLDELPWKLQLLAARDVGLEHVQHIVKVRERGEEGAYYDFIPLPDAGPRFQRVRIVGIAP